jgi:protease I
MYAFYRIAEDDFEVVVTGPEARHYHLVVHEVPPNSDVPWDITRELPSARIPPLRPGPYANHASLLRS